MFNKHVPLFTYLQASENKNCISDLLILRQYFVLLLTLFSLNTSLVQVLVDPAYYFYINLIGVYYVISPFIFMLTLLFPPPEREREREGKGGGFTTKL